MLLFVEICRLNPPLACPWHMALLVATEPRATASMLSLSKSMHSQRRCMTEEATELQAGDRRHQAAAQLLRMISGLPSVAAQEHLVLLSAEQQACVATVTELRRCLSTNTQPVLQLARCCLGAARGQLAWWLMLTTLAAAAYENRPPFCASRRRCSRVSTLRISTYEALRSDG